MLLTIGSDYLPVVQTGLQTLCIIAAGRLAASRGLFDPVPVCRTLNRFVVVVCLPALQFWLLAIKTDMRNMEHWRAVGAFMLWTLLVQMGCTAWVTVFEGGRLSRICVHSLTLAANNTGILAPVVLEAAVGPSAAAVGMLATIVLYFQQLPMAMVLFEMDRMGDKGRGKGAGKGSEGGGGAGSASGGGSSRCRTDALPATSPAPTAVVLSKKHDDVPTWGVVAMAPAAGGGGGGAACSAAAVSAGGRGGSGSDHRTAPYWSPTAPGGGARGDVGGGGSPNKLASVHAALAPGASPVTTAKMLLLMGGGGAAAAAAGGADAPAGDAGVGASPARLYGSQQQLTRRGSLVRLASQPSDEALPLLGGGDGDGRGSSSEEALTQHETRGPGSGVGGGKGTALTSGSWMAGGVGQALLSAFEKAVGSPLSSSSPAAVASAGEPAARGGRTSALAGAVTLEVGCGGSGDGAAGAAVVVVGGRSRSAIRGASEGSGGGGGARWSGSGYTGSELEAQAASYQHQHYQQRQHHHQHHHRHQHYQQQQHVLSSSQQTHHLQHHHQHHHAPCSAPSLDLLSASADSAHVLTTYTTTAAAAAPAATSQPPQPPPPGPSAPHLSRPPSRFHRPNFHSSSSSSSTSSSPPSPSLPTSHRAAASTHPAPSTTTTTTSTAEPSLRHALQLVLSNALMWTTGSATIVSMLGLHALLDPAVPSHIPELGFVEGTLSWLARCSVPLSLFAMGLFISSRPGCGVSNAAAARDVVAYLAVKLLLLPWLMVFVNSCLGLDGRLARSLVVLTCVPVGQNAFLVTEQYGEGAEAVTGVMQLLSMRRC